jgi:hypothetical protein
MVPLSPRPANKCHVSSNQDQTIGDWKRNKWKRKCFYQLLPHQLAYLHLLNFDIFFQEVQSHDHTRVRDQQDPNGMDPDKQGKHA